VNLPNYLTLARIIIVPMLVVVMLTPLAEAAFGVTRYSLAIVLFLVAAFTDFFDGHLARRRNQVSKFGTLLDPVADKLLVCAALVALVEKQLAPAWMTVIILGREFAVTGLRSIAASEGLIISANMTGKIKMWAQCIAIVSLMVIGANTLSNVANPGAVFPNLRFWETNEFHTAFRHLFSFAVTPEDWRVFGFLIGNLALWVAVITSLWSMYEYFSLFRRAHKEREMAEAAVEALESRI
jgi:CDP-diacylglycerol--glycerol-3-phosphate 3-phosphatidyltransferase